jgi:hypothetical protein
MFLDVTFTKYFFLFFFFWWDWGLAVVLFIVLNEWIYKGDIVIKTSLVQKRFSQATKIVFCIAKQAAE